MFRETLTTRLLRWDNANAQIIRNGKSEVITLNTLMPSRMAMDRDTKGWFHYKQYSSSARMPQRWRVSSSTCLSSDMPQIPGFSLSLLSSKCVVFAYVPRDFQRLAEYFSYGWRRKGLINRSCLLKIGAGVRTVRWEIPNNTHPVPVLKDTHPFLSIYSVDALCRVRESTGQGDSPHLAAAEAPDRS